MRSLNRRSKKKKMEGMQEQGLLQPQAGAHPSQAAMGQDQTLEMQRLLFQHNEQMRVVMERLQMQEQEIHRLRAERARTVSISSEPPQPNGLAGSPAVQEAATVDLRQLGKPDLFKGTVEDFNDWAFILKSYLACVDGNYVQLLERVEATRHPMPNRSLSPTEQKLSTRLYYIVVLLVRNRPLDIVYNSGVGEGVEAYRRLWEEYSPKVASRFVGALSLLLSTKFGKDLEAEFNSFERALRQFELESGKSVDEEMLLGIIVNGLTDQGLRDHIIRNSSRLSTYSAVRSELMEVARTNRVLQQLPQPMEIGATPGKYGKGDGKAKGKGKHEKGKGKKGDGKGNGKANAHADKKCHYCGKTGHIKSECRKKAADEKAASGHKGGKAKGKGKPAGAVPEEEPEPVSGALMPEDLSYVAASPLKQMILVDTGAGDHLFQAGFDPKAVEAPGKGRQLMTVTGQDLCTESRKRSMFGVAGGGTLSIDYGVSDKVQFSIMSVGTAASKGMWTVIGPNTQCMVAPQHARELEEVVKNSKTLDLEKRRGVYWLPVDLGHAGSTAGQATLVAAARPVKKAVPASMFPEEAEEAAEAPVERQGGSSGSKGPEAPDPPPEPPAEVSEASRKVRQKKIPPSVSQEEYDAHMITHLPFRSWCSHCVAGKVREDDHRPREPGSELEVPKVSIDYCYFGRVLASNVDPEEADALKNSCG